jgi:ABC-type bacteriocin/lantibiotic exporter with double-glycine peptidase domain
MVAILLILAAIAASAPLRGDVDAQVQQFHANRSRCGPLCGWYALRALGHDVQLEEFAARLTVTDQGVPFGELFRAIQAVEPRARAVAGSPHAIEQLPTPFLLVISDRHAVVVTAIDGAADAATIFEPSTMKAGPEPLPQLIAAASGQAIVFAPPRPSPTRFYSTMVLTALAVCIAGLFVALRFRTPRAAAVAELAGSAPT